MIRQRGTFSYSEFFYAIDFSSMQWGKYTSSHGQFVTVPAIWFKRKNGVDAICSGHLSVYSSVDNPVVTEHDFINRHDGRGGGSTEYKWDGTEMWGSDNNFKGLIAAHKRLDPLLEAFEDSKEIPYGFDGWFAINK